LEVFPWPMSSYTRCSESIAFAHTKPVSGRARISPDAGLMGCGCLLQLRWNE
jgi:hypothetical protein